MDEIIKKYKLFWQYPVITEKTFYNQNKNDENFIGFPWATIIDTQIDLNMLYNILKPIIKLNKNYYTCCQHIHFRNLITLFNKLRIKKIYVPHKCKNEDTIQEIQILPCPLYAVNIENKTFFKDELLSKKREILYSFAGGYDPNWYLTDIRPRIFQMKHPPHTYIRDTGTWHFAGIVFSEKQNIKGELNIDAKYTENTKKYNELLLCSRYTLSPSGSGPNSIRFWEALGAGSIPILLADTLDLPAHELWEKAILRVAEKDLENIPTLLGQISLEEERKRRENCLTLYSHFKNNYRNK